MQTRTTRSSSVKGSHATKVMLGSPMHIMNHMPSADLMAPGPTTHYGLTLTTLTDELGNYVDEERTWVIKSINRSNEVQGISKGELLTTNYADMTNGALIYNWVVGMPGEVSSVQVDPAIPSVQVDPAVPSVKLIRWSSRKLRRIHVNCVEFMCSRTCIFLTYTGIIFILQL